MVKTGQFNNLTVLRKVAFGLYLDGGDWGDILLPSKFVPQGIRINDRLDVFVCFDSEDRIIATTLNPLARAESFAFLRVVDVNSVGAFLDWGLDKDLLVPRPQQQRPMEKNKYYLVYVTRDERGRIFASSRLDHFLNQTQPQFRPGEEVSLLVAEKVAPGIRVIINDRHWGMVHSADVFQSPPYGQRVPGYIKTVREDGKIDVLLRKPGQDSVRELAQRILVRLHESGGFLPLHDKSSPLEISRAFGESKKSYKSAIGNLYKRGDIVIEPNGIRLSGKIGPAPKAQ